MVKIRESYNVFEIILLIVGAVAATISFAVFKGRSFAAYLSAILGLLGTVGLWKHVIFAPAICDAFTFLYAFVCVIAGNFGDMFFNLFIMTIVYTVMQVALIIKHFKKSGAQVQTVEIKKISIMEYIIVIAALVGAGFIIKNVLVDAGCENLIVNIIAFVFGTAAVYLMIRNFKYQDIVFTIYRLILVAMWILTVQVHGMAYLPLVIVFSILSIYDIYRQICLLRGKRLNPPDEMTNR